jgi:hypothetical protein
MKFNTFICSALLLSLTACTGSKKSNVATIDAASIVASTTLSKEQKADKLAKAAEQLLTAQGFSYANDVADLALEVDSANLRAQFVKALLGPIMVQKGIYKRVKPLADLDQATSEQYALEVAQFENQVPNSTVKEFLFDGQEDIKNEADIQNYFDAFANSFKVIREFAKSNKNSELKVMTSDAFYQKMLERYATSCEVYQTGHYEYETNCPDVREMLEVSLNRADFEAIQHMAAGMELYLSLMNSYNLTGSIEKAISSKGQDEESQKVLEDLLKNKDFATIRSGNGFQKVKTMGLDYIAGARWVMQMQNKLCPLGEMNPKNRIGMLLNNGLCTDKSNAVNDSLNLSKVMDVLNGKVIENVEFGREYSWEYDAVTNTWVDTSKPGYFTNVKPMAIFDTPIADLRSLAPTAYDKCGQVTAIKDPTFGGVFVKGDYNVLLSRAECDVE